MNNKNGFTLIELMIVVAIIGILVALAIPRYGDMIEKANHGATLGNLAAIRSAINIYYGQNSAMPDSLDVQNNMFGSVMGSVLPGVKVRYPAGVNSPYGDAVTYGTGVPSSSGAGWFYDNAKGYIYINSIEQDIFGKSYTLY